MTATDLIFAIISPSSSYLQPPNSLSQICPHCPCPGPHTFKADPAILISLVPLPHCPPLQLPHCCQGSLQTKNRIMILFCLKSFNDSPKPKKKTQTPQGPSWTGPCPYLPLWTHFVTFSQCNQQWLLSIMQQILLPVHSATKQCYSLCLDIPSSSLSPPLNTPPSPPPHCSAIISLGNLPWCSGWLQCPDTTALGWPSPSVCGMFPQTFNNPLTTLPSLCEFWISTIHFFHCLEYLQNIQVNILFFLWSSLKSPQNMFPHSSLWIPHKTILSLMNKKVTASSHFFQVRYTLPFSVSGILSLLGNSCKTPMAKPWYLPPYTKNCKFSFVKWYLKHTTIMGPNIF